MSHRRPGSSRGPDESGHPRPRSQRAGFDLSPGFAPSRARGQNFLIDPNLARRLVESLEAGPGDTVLEIGPGTGALTRGLLACSGHVVAIETDRMLAAFLRETLGADPKLELIEADALGVDLAVLAGREPLRVISNLPYSITSPVLVKILVSPVRFERAVFTMQKEVAQRLAAGPGSKTYGRLSVLIALAGRVTTLFDLPPSAFRPRPGVVSRAIAFVPAPRIAMADFPGSWLEAVIRAAFGTRRKQIATALAQGLHLDRPAVGAALARVGVDPRARAETLEPDAFLALAGALEPPATFSPGRGEARSPHQD